MNRERLLRLADFLEKEVPDDQFDMGQWASKEALGECGTAGCALGWATCIPEMREAGLHLKMMTQDFFGVRRNEVAVQLRGQEPVPYNSIQTSLQSAKTCFELNNADATFLFLPENYPDEEISKDVVCGRIREVANRADV
jgi:hypothetical protein